MNLPTRRGGVDWLPGARGCPFKTGAPSSSKPVNCSHCRLRGFPGFTGDFRQIPALALIRFRMAWESARSRRLHAGPWAIPGRAVCILIGWRGTHFPTRLEWAEHFLFRCIRSVFFKEYGS
ncbi:hypothetical protein [Azohydromonas aeria]|uniref:hypothetical protein n=1 Tax=Azohydromonas aeria TaxID=2590212 RepID=UPI0012F877C5|nr:hypothetical protein [Azohydromonas aeria]